MVQVAVAVALVVQDELLSLKRDQYNGAGSTGGSGAIMVRYLKTAVA
jgi:hypothetical protein